MGGGDMGAGPQRLEAYIGGRLRHFESEVARVEAAEAARLDAARR